MTPAVSVPVTVSLMPSPRPIALSKTRVLAGLQCPKRLYLQLTAPGLAEAPDAAREFRFAQGHAVGRLAQQAFPGGVTLDAGRDHLEEALSRTASLVRDPAVPAIFEATFRHDDVLVRVDVLARGSRGGWRLIEVKSTTGVREHHLPDVAIQRHVLEGSGLTVESVAVMHLSRDYVYAGGPYDPMRLFAIADVAPQVDTLTLDLPRLLIELRATLAAAAAPEIAPGLQCTKPYFCEFYDQCNVPRPLDDLANLPGLHGKRLDALRARGITRIGELPDDVALSPRQERARQAVAAERLRVAAPLAGELAGLAYPRYFMDFETLGAAIPRYAGMRPYDGIPFQWSVHVIHAPGAAPEHRQFLADSDVDPRRRFLETLVAAVGETGPIVVYNAGFEGQHLDALGLTFPDLAPAAARIRARLWDLLPVVRNHVAHPDFRGSFSLKSVLPALVPALAYDDLDISEGSAAGPVWDRLVRGHPEPAEAARLESALREYCRRDTLGMVELVRALTAPPSP
jgi:hypothetical protein